MRRNPPDKRATWYGKEPDTYALPVSRARSAWTAARRVAADTGVPLGDLRYEGLKVCDLVGAAQGGYADDPRPCYMFAKAGPGAPAMP